MKNHGRNHRLFCNRLIVNKKLIEGILKFCHPAVIEEIKEIPTFIQTMGDPGVLSITRIVRKLAKDELYSWDSDFSRKTILEHKEKGYVTAKKATYSQKKVKQ